jgi:hypothetical protein
MCNICTMLEPIASVTLKSNSGIILLLIDFSQQSMQCVRKSLGVMFGPGSRILVLEIGIFESCKLSPHENEAL